MKIEATTPPNYKEIIKHFPAVEHNENVVFTYGNTLYMPHAKEGQVVSEDLMVHEAVHMKQQDEIGPDNWWQHYFDDPQFRVEQETEAYRAQYAKMKDIYNRKYRRMLLDKIADDLSGPIYGHVVSKDEAIRRITG